MTLVVVPTPIGNLEDITLRALRALREADAIACEDTRRTGRLLAHYEIKQNLIAYHEHNEERLAPELAQRAKTERIALVTDAGTPLVSDPGHRLVRACIEAGVEVETLPGPSALTTALVASGLSADTVVFTGFSPRKKDLTLYIMPGFEKHAELMKQLGRHSTGKSCLYIKRLSDIHVPTLKKLIKASVKWLQDKTISQDF